ncbi:MAG: exosome complex RNA-binding protein Rrp4 [Candidatus Woesearchaeota archaeon]|nr:exosome complex RNA-binding protein Rrp4 [Candidatus Woesearchaeota archaeon]
MVKDKDVVVPGEVLATGMDYLPSFGTYRLGDDIRASKLGLVKTEGKVVKIIPLSGRYLPKRGDTLVAEVIDVLMSGWLLNFNSAYSAMLSMKEATARFITKGSDLTRIFAIGDYVTCQIINVTSQKLVDVSMRGPGLRKLDGGRVIEVNTNKVPRIIGKEGSMISMIKNATACRITVGQNGFLWLQGEPELENVAILAIRKIEQEAHTDGLTERIKEFLEKNLKGMKIPERKDIKEEENGGGGSGGYRREYSNEGGHGGGFSGRYGGSHGSNSYNNNSNSNSPNSNTSFSSYHNNGPNPNNNNSGNNNSNNNDSKDEW